MDLSKRAKVLILILLLQAIFTIFTILLVISKDSLFGNAFRIPSSLIVIIGVLSLFGLYQIKKVVEISNDELEAEANYNLLQEKSKVVENLRSYKHDFLNHLQLISGMIQVGKDKEKVLASIQKIALELNEVKQACEFSTSEIAGLLNIKKLEAEKRKIRFKFEFAAEQTKDVNIPSTDVVRILGNLIENAIAASEKVKDIKKREIKVKLWKEAESLNLLVYNKCPVIPKELHEKIFERGFTTKHCKESGLGLDIVRTLVSKYNGKIELKSEENLGTSFSISLPLNS